MAKMAERRRCGTFLVLYMTHTSQRRLNLSNSTALLPRPDFPMIGRATNLSRKINATESTNQLIWTALVAVRPCWPLRRSSALAAKKYCGMVTVPARLSTRPTRSP